MPHRVHLHRLFLESPPLLFSSILSVSVHPYSLSKLLFYVPSSTLPSLLSLLSYLPLLLLIFPFSLNPTFLSPSPSHSLFHTLRLWSRSSCPSSSVLLQPVAATVSGPEPNDIPRYCFPFSVCHGAPAALIFLSATNRLSPSSESSDNGSLSSAGKPEAARGGGGVHRIIADHHLTDPAVVECNFANRSGV